MCDFFWLSPADQGDLSDVVRASLQQPTPPHQRLEDEESLLQLVQGDGMGFMVSNNSGSSCDHAVLLHPQPQQSLQPEMDEHGSLGMATAPHHHAPAIKRRKSQTKKVVCIPAPTAAPAGVGGRASTSGEVVPSDLWAWRKYGQKPIKGSPYPRGYYRCSSSKACTARKQVERSRTDPSMLVITYTSDHNHPWPTHRNALAGSTRPITTSSSANNKSHQHHHDHSAAAAHAAVPPPSLLRRRRHHHANNNNIVVDNNVTPSSITIIGNTTDHHEQLPKQEEVMDHPQPEQQDVAAADHDSDMLADIDGCALNILSASNFINSKEQQQHTTADDDNCLEKLPEEDDKQQLDPFSFSFFDWVDASFGVGGE